MPIEIIVVLNVFLVVFIIFFWLFLFPALNNYFFHKRVDKRKRPW
jgi:hypothetical protein